MLVWLGWMTNLYNFMDGADGLAGGMAAIGFGTLALSAGLGGVIDLAVLCASISLAALAFLGFNFPPARIFMGDGGSIPLGFLAAALGWAGSIQGAWPGWYPALVFAPFVVDASWTLGQRMLKGEKFWRPHRDHHYQKMVRMGLGHRETVLRWYGALVVGSLIALGMRGLTPAWQLGVGVGWLGCLVGAGWLIDRRWAAHASTP
jgi:UDP-N-acetylmuramyl pentapeptide phosphotransferase/UDP-N-acetylglucosamine-1-phosphate transferase